MPLRVTKRKGSDFYQVEGTIAGRRFRRSAETTSKAVADQKRRKWERELEDRASLGDAATRTFAEAVVLYLENGGDGRFLPKILDRIGNEKLCEIDQNTMDELHRELYPKAKASTVNRQLYVPIVAVMTKAAKRKWCNVPVWDRPKGYADKKQRVRWLTPEEVATVVSILKPHHRIALTMGVGIGLRESDLLRADRDDASLAGAELLMDIGKQGITRRFFLQPNVVAAISTLPYQEGPILRNAKGEPYKITEGSGGTLHAVWQRAAERASIERFSSHDLRHTFATWHYAMHRDRLKLQVEGHWASDDMIDVYTHMAPPDLRQRLLDHGWTMEAARSNEEQTGVRVWQ